MANQGEEFLELCEKLADKGSVEHQLFLGRHHYKLAKRATERAADSDEADDVTEGGDGQKAVMWLLKAAKNGSMEATEILHLCMDGNIGLPPETEKTIKDYFGPKTLHKHVKRKATTKLFHKLHGKLTPEKPTVSKDDLVEAIKEHVPELDSGDEKMIKRLARKIEKSNVQTEEEFVSAVKNHMKTSSPLYVDTEQYEKTPIQDKIARYPLKTAEVVGVRILEGASKRGTKWLWTFVPYRQIQMMVAFCVYSLISLDALLFAIPLVLFYGSILIMVITSLQIIYGKQKVQNLTKWAKILNHFEPDVDAKAEERKKTTKMITPFLWTYFVSLLVAVTSFAYADRSYIACSECSILSLFLAFGVLTVNLGSDDLSVLVSVALNMFVSLPHIFKNLPHIPVIYHMVAVITKPLLKLSLIPGFTLNVSFPALAYVAIPFVFLNMARNKTGSGLHAVLIPHLVAISWWHLGVMFYCAAPWLGLLRATFGYGAIVFLFPVASVLVFGLAIVAIVKLFSWASLLKCLITIALVVLPILLSMWYKSDKRLQNLPPKYKTVLMVFISVAAIASSLSVLQEDAVIDRSMLKLSWKSYNAFCGSKALKRDNSAQLQVRCTHLEGTLVKWRGTVNSVKISSVENVILNVLDVLPQVMSEQLKCIYGQPFKPCANATKNDRKYFQKWRKPLDEDDDLDDTDDDDVDEDDDINARPTVNDTEQADVEYCRFVDFYSSKCHVDQFNHYRFSVKISVGDSQTFDLQVGHHFRHLAFSLRPGSRVKFIGRLQSGLGTSSPTIRAYQMRCLNCARSANETGSRFRRFHDKERGVSFAKRSIQSFGFVFNFFLSPLVTFETDPGLNGNGDAA